LLLALLKRSRIEGWVFNHLCYNISLWLSTSYRNFDVKKNWRCVFSRRSGKCELYFPDPEFVRDSVTILILDRSWKTYNVSSNKKFKRRQK
jgi:hypothetical protein